MIDKVIVSQSQLVICLNISVCGEEIDISQNSDFARFQRTSIVQDLEFLWVHGIIQYTLIGNTLKSKLSIPFDKISVDRSQNAVTDRLLSHYKSSQLKQLHWYVTPTDENINAAEHSFLQLREMFSKNADWATLKLSELTYPDYLKTPFWQVLAYRVKADAKWQCAACNSKENLNAHHREYPQRGTEILNHNSILTCFCEKCHSIFHKAQN